MVFVLPAEHRVYLPRRCGIHIVATWWPRKKKPPEQYFVHGEDKVVSGQAAFTLSPPNAHRITWAKLRREEKIGGKLEP